MDRPRSLTMSVADVLNSMPSPVNELARTAANVPVQSMVIDFEIVSVLLALTNSPESRQLMLPPALVFAKAPTNVRHGAAMVHAAPSLPECETQDRSFCACAGRALSRRHATPTSDRKNKDGFLDIVASQCCMNQPCAAVAPMRTA